MAHLTQVTATWDMEGEDLYILLQENKTKHFFFLAEEQVLPTMPWE